MEIRESVSGRIAMPEAFAARTKASSCDGRIPCYIRVRITKRGFATFPDIDA
jgi:hypothetical protein